RRRGVARGDWGWGGGRGAGGSECGRGSAIGGDWAWVAEGLFGGKFWGECTERDLSFVLSEKRFNTGLESRDHRENVLGDRWLPRSLHCAARRATKTARKKKSGRSGRDDGIG